MSAGRIDRSRSTSRATPQVSAAAESAPLSLPAHAVTIRKNGIEFQSMKPLTPWTEMTLDIESSHEHKRVTCRGVVVACDGNRHKGYQISLLFVGLTPQVQERLESLSLSHLR